MINISFFKIIDTYINIIKRYPLEILSGIIGSIIFISLVMKTLTTNDIISNILMKIGILCILGFFLFLNVTLIGNKIKNNIFKILGYIISILFLGIYYIILPGIIDNFVEITILNYFIINFIAYLGVYFISYINEKDNKSIWNSSYRIILAQIIAFIFGAVLFIGIAVLLASLKFLFDINISYQIYSQLFIFIVGVIGVPIALNFMPSDNTAEENYLYNKFLNVFSQYILTFLSAAYIIILYIYTGKIVISGIWPSGEVSWLITFFSIIGIGSTIFLTPIKDNEGNGRIKKYIKLFYILMIPLIIVYFTAYYIRIQEYGITVNRYYAILYGIYLSLLSLFFIIGKFRLKIIGLSMIILLIISIYGPQSAYNISKTSQMNIVKATLQKENLINNGKIISSKNTISGDNYYKIQSSLTYLINNGGYKEIENIIPDDLAGKISTEKYTYNQVAEIMDYLGKPEERTSDSINGITDNYFYFNSDSNSSLVTAVSGYNYIVEFYTYRNDNINESKAFSIGEEKYNIIISGSSLNISGQNISQSIDILPAINQLLSNSQYRSHFIDNSSINIESPEYKIILKDIQGNIKDGNKEITSISGILLIK